MKKKIVIITIVFILLILLFPIKQILKDGGTVEYKAVLYTITNRHSMGIEQSTEGFYIGTEIKVLFFEVYNDVEFVPIVPDEMGE